MTGMARAYLLLSVTILLTMTSLVGWIDWVRVGQIAASGFLVFCLFVYLLPILAVVVGGPVLLTVLAGYGLAKLCTGSNGSGGGPSAHGRGVR